MFEKKIKKREDLKPILEGLKKKGKIVVFTNGCFDIMHSGHVKCLEEAKANGDVLVVGINSDESLKKIKGEDRPIVDEKGRSHVVAALESVDYVTIFDEETPLQTIKLLLPNVLIKGGDWSKKDIVGSDIVEKTGGEVRNIPLVKGYSTSGIIKKIKRSG